MADIPVSQFPDLIPPNSLPASALVSVGDANTFPQLTNAAVGGWMYLNFDSCRERCAPDRDASQNWVVVSMRAEGRYSTDTPAAMLGNGCSRSTPKSEVGVGVHVIAPAPNVRPQ